ncbi:MAG: ATP-binding cassette domain-containing protein [Actinomycetota bacterium]
MNTRLLSIRGVHRDVDGAAVLRDVDLELSWEGFAVIAGASGSGKTSLLRLMNRLDVPTGGTVAWNEVDVANGDPCELRRRVGYIAQHPLVFEGTALDNLRVAEPALTRPAAEHLLGRVGLGDKIDQSAATLSGGEAQRLCIARTLATAPEVILADEPTASLDGEATENIELLARRLTDTDGVRWVWVSHDPAQIRRLANTVIVMSEGTVAAVGTIDALRGVDHPAVHQALGAA